MSHSIMIMGEQSQGKILPVTHELVSCAAMIAGFRHSTITVVLPGHIASQPAFPGADLLVINSPGLMDYTAETWEKAALLAAEQLKPEITIIAHTSTGYDYAPRVAAQLGGGCITSVGGLEISGDRMRFRRNSFHGKLDLLYDSGTRPLVFTLLPGAFPEQDPASAPGTVRVIGCDIHPRLTSNLQLNDPDQSNTELEHADVIISAGRGIGSAENLKLIESMAACFKRSAIAGSRIACDRGWIAYNAQVGLTGKTVAPQLYVACGISGAAQHIAGMKGSKTIVAVNRDPEAAIFRHSDICIVEDLEKFIPEFVNEAAKHRV